MLLIFVTVLQDLSVYSWLDCEPDDLYKLTHYSLSDVQDLLPHPVQDYLTHWRQNGAGMQHVTPWLSAMGHFSFTARPMQVSRDTNSRCWDSGAGLMETQSTQGALVHHVM